MHDHRVGGSRVTRHVDRRRVLYARARGGDSWRGPRSCCGPLSLSSSARHPVHVAAARRRGHYGRRAVVARERLRRMFVSGRSERSWRARIERRSWRNVSRPRDLNLVSSGSVFSPNFRRFFGDTYFGRSFAFFGSALANFTGLSMRGRCGGV